MKKSTLTLLFVAYCGVSVFGHASVAQQPAAPLVQPGQPATPAKAAKPRIYDESADVKAQIVAAVAKAKRENRRVLVQWGGNWCGWCTILHDGMTKDRDISRTLLYEYDVVHADSGQPAGKNVDLAMSYGADLKKHGFPFLTVLDGDGRAIANQDTGSLEIEGEMKHDAKLVLAFLKKHAAEPRDAQATLDAAMSEAKSTGRAVFLHFGAPWCTWCHRLDGWMERPDVAPLLDRDFVNLKIDIDRMTGGKELLTKYRGPKEGGIPWFVFLDAAGKTLATSDGPAGNVGFPASVEEIAHFESMLAKAARKLSKDEQAKLIESLRKSDRPGAAPHAPSAPGAPTGGR